MKILQVSDEISIKRSVEAGTDEQRTAVKAIINDVRINGDYALKQYTEKFDGITLSNLLVSEEEIHAAYSEVSDNQLAIIQEAAANIRAFHEKQLRPSWMTTEENGTILGQKITPLDSVGLYVPGNGSISFFRIDECYSG